MFSDGSGIQVFWNRMKAYLSGVSTPAILPIPVVSIASEEPGSTHLILSSDYAGLDAEVRYKKGSEPADTDTLFPSDGLDITEDGTYYFRAFSTDSAHIDSPSLMMDISVMELPQLDAPQITQSVMDEGALMTISNWYDYPSGTFVYTTAGTMLNSNNYIIFDDDFTADTMEVTITVNCEGYLSASTTVTVNKPVRQLPTPILSTQESGGNIYAVLSNVDNYPDDALVYYSHTLSNPLEGNEYMTISSLKNASVKGAIVMLTISLATLFVAVSCDGYQDSDVGNIDYEFPTLQTPTLSLSRSGSTVSGTVGNRVTGATYRYKVGSAPTSDSDGSAVSSSGTFSFTNSSAVTVYVKGFMDGYKDSSAVSRSVSAYNPAPTNWVATDNKLSFGHGICYGNGRFVAVGTGNEGSYSYDGITWTAIDDTKLTKGNSICYGGGKFVAVGDYGKGSYSYNGITWTAIDDMKVGNDYDSTLSSVCYGGGKYVAVGRNGKGSYSADGINWTAIEDTKFGESYINSICYGNGRFVAIGDDHKGAYSYDGITWTATDNIKLENGFDICYGDGKFVAIGLNSDSSYSYDGITWTATDIKAETHSAECICYGNGVFVIILIERLSYSYDGITWTAIDNVVNGDDICYGNGRFATLQGNICYYCIF